MKTVLSTVLVSLCTVAAQAQTNQAFALWPDGAPGALGKEDKDIPTLTPYFPEVSKATGDAVVICPGGGYGGLAPHEGVDYARFLNEQGIAGFVLKYRLGPAGYRHPIMLQDASRAMRTVRARANEWHLDPQRIGIMGSSAGGHLASTLLTHFDHMGEFTHQGSKANLLGKDPSPELVRNLSNELQVTKETPPTFLWHTWEDTAVPVENTLQFAEALRKVGVPFDLHIYQKGQHGLGLGSNKWDPKHRHPWTGDLVYWLKVQGFEK